MSRKDNDHSDRFSTTMGGLGRKTQQTLRREEWSGDLNRTRVSVRPEEQPREWPTRRTKKEGGYITKQTPCYLQRDICQLFLKELSMHYRLCYMKC